MGTRGLFGFYYKGKYYLVYNHYDSYPDGLGNDIVYEINNALKTGEFNTWLNLFLSLKIVTYNDIPTDKDINALHDFTDLNVSTKSTSDWYCLLRGCQGSLTMVLKSGYLLNYAINDTFEFLEYSYIVNFDTDKFDFYVGNDLINSYDFNNLPKW